MPNAAPVPGGPPLTALPLLVGGTPLYVSGEEQLQATVLNCASGIIIRVTGRFLPVESTRVLPFNFDLSPNSTRTAYSRANPLGEGWLLNATAIVSTGTPLLGQTWLRLALVRGGPTAGLEVAQLAYGYVTGHKYVTWPFSGNDAPLDGPGALRSLTGTAPGAGNNLSETVPTGARWQLLALRTQFVTSAVVATRVVSVLLDDGTNVFATGSAQATQAASQTMQYTIAPGLVAGFSGSDNRFAVQLPPHVHLPAGARIRTAVLNLDAGDAFSAPQYLVREWIAGE